MFSKIAVLATVSLFVGSAFANSITGTYQPDPTPECAALHFDSTQTIAVNATDTELTIGTNYDFTVGTVTNPPSTALFNEFVPQFVSAYAADGSFKAVENIIDRLNPTQVYKYAGEVDVWVNGNTLEVSDSLSTDGQFNPAPSVTCWMTKTN